jgi:hypothetical protein
MAKALSGQSGLMFFIASDVCLPEFAATFGSQRSGGRFHGWPVGKG